MKRIKSFICLSLCAILLCASTSVPVLATTIVKPDKYFQIDRTYYVNISEGSTLNIRSGPGTSYSTVGSLERADFIICDGSNTAGTWLHIEPGYGAPEGWVSAIYVEIEP